MHFNKGIAIVGNTTEIGCTKCFRTLLTNLRSNSPYRVLALAPSHSKDIDRSTTTYCVIAIIFNHETSHKYAVHKRTLFVDKE